MLAIWIMGNPANTPATIRITVNYNSYSSYRTIDINSDYISNFYIMHIGYPLAANSIISLKMNPNYKFTNMDLIFIVTRLG